MKDAVNSQPYVMNRDIRAVVESSSHRVEELENELRSMRHKVEVANHTRQKYELSRQENDRKLAKERERANQLDVELTKKLEPNPPRDAKIKQEAEVAGQKAYVANELTKVARVGSPSMTVSATFGLSPDAFYGAQHHKDIRVLERIAMKMGSERAREAVALGATDQRMPLSGLLTLARGTLAGIFDKDVLEVVRGWNRRSLLSLARILADQAIRPADRLDAISIYELVLKAFGPWALDTRARLIFIETLHDLDRFARATDLMQLFELRQTDPTQSALLRCNEIMSKEGPSENWLNLINEGYKNYGLSLVSIDLESEESDLLDKLHVEASPIHDGPLVSVMMPTYNGSRWIRTAVNSVLNQTWQNIELIIVDDYSDISHWNHIQDLAREDKRISIFRLESNQGAYRARNLAFSKARGEYVTVHDDDDWSHPQKIETQVRHLLDNTDEVGNMSYQARIDENYQFLRINDNPQFNQRNYSSIMMRRDLVKQVGGWDDINRAADAEFHDRIRVLTQRSIVGVETFPLSFMRARSGSLTSGEIQRGALDFARQTFGLLYGSWHKQLKEIKLEDQIPADIDPTQRHYVVPANMLPGNRNVKYNVFDVIFITDFRFPGGNSSLMASELAAGAAAGLNIAIAQLDSPILRANHVFNEQVHDVIRQYAIPVLTLTDNVETQLLVVRNPSVLQYAERLRPNIQASRVIIVANSAPIGSNGSNYCYEIGDCVVSAARMFGSEPIVFPESPQTRALLEAITPEIEYANSNWPGFIKPQDYKVIRNVDPTRQPIVGRHSRDHPLKWPESCEDIRSVYVQPAAYETRILGGADSIRSVLDLEAEDGVKVLPFGSVPPAAFLETVDFWVYQHNSALTESFGMSIIEAMASGAVVILPRYMQKLFQDAALYADPQDVKGTVLTYWNDPDLYLQQSKKAEEAVAQHFSVRAFTDKLIDLTLGESSQRTMLHKLRSAHE